MRWQRRHSPAMLDIVAALSAFVAAVFWFVSAYGKLPPMLPYWDAIPEDDPFYMAVKFSARMNRWAAGFSGLSALCMSAKLFT
jgi:hypothetical protein